MLNQEIKQALNLAQAELKRCYRELRTRNKTVNDLVNEYTEAHLNSAKPGLSYCWKNESGVGSTCYFKCEECKMKDNFQTQAVKPHSATPVPAVSNYPLFFPN